MRWASVHKAICVLALLVIGAMSIIDLLLREDKSGFQLYKDSILLPLLIVLFYAISVTGFVVGYQYAAMERKKNWLFWISLICIVLTGLLTVPISVEQVKDWIVPPRKSIFDHWDLFDISENRKKLNNQQDIVMLALAILQIASLVTLVRLRVLYKKAPALFNSQNQVA
jgi:hypothetical protein